MSGTVLLLHGFTQSGASWREVAAMLPERYRPLAPDLRGHGASSEVQPVTLAAVIDDLAALVPEEFVLAGYSMGGRIALHVALALPGQVRRLVLVGASPGIADAAGRAQRRSDDERLAQEIERSTTEVFAQRWADIPVLAGQAPEVRAAANADRLRSSPAGLGRALRGLGTGALPSLWARLGELPMPVALIVGERDEKFRAVAMQMAQRLERATVVVVAGAGHAVHLEAPEAVAEAILG